MVRRQICTMSGLLATPECPRQRAELYIDGTEPTAPDNVYQTFTLNKLTGQLADNSTPADERVQKVFAVLPQEARDWGLRNGIPLPPSGAAVRVTDKTECCGCSRLTRTRSSSFRRYCPPRRSAYG